MEHNVEFNNKVYKVLLRKAVDKYVTEIFDEDKVITALQLDCIASDDLIISDRKIYIPHNKIL